MEWLKRINNAIDYIEHNLDSDISYDEAAQIACCSTYYFQRMFSYITGISLAEYIKRRRMTQAAFELQRTNKRVLEIALKYGYTSPTSFNRAFQNVHGISPVAAKDIGNTLNAYPAIRFSVNITGGSAMSYHIEKKGPLRIVGVRTPLVEDSETNMKNVPDFWLHTLTTTQFHQICNFRQNEPKGILGVTVYHNGSIVCTVNSFTSDEYASYDDSNGDDYDSAKRYKVVMNSFIDKITSNYLENTMSLLKGEYGFMCQYEDPNFQTVWSSIFNLKNLMIYRAEGDPRKKKFITDSRLHDIKFGR